VQGGWPTWKKKEKVGGMKKKDFGLLNEEKILQVGRI
jgi:hypothetical protein